MKKEKAFKSSLTQRRLISIHQAAINGENNAALLTFAVILLILVAYEINYARKLLQNDVVLTILK